ncbi:hypothetical protein OG381_07400 [Streptomyces sp. NBC_00490]|uniref:hypothetical protein n=1 Tax=Streptomyces sp. NBC_00490 TaxID=2903657 RepID=UPI002E19EA22
MSSRGGPHPVVRVDADGLDADGLDARPGHSATAVARRFCLEPHVPRVRVAFVLCGKEAGLSLRANCPHGDLLPCRPSGAASRQAVRIGEAVSRSPSYGETTDEGTHGGASR